MGPERALVLKPLRAHEHDVACVPIGELNHPSYRFRTEHVVLIEVEHVVASGEVGADVAGSAGSPGVRLVDDVDVRVRCGVAVKHGAGAVGGAVVDGDHLEHPARDVLLQDGVQAWA